MDRRWPGGNVPRSTADCSEDTPCKRVQCTLNLKRENAFRECDTEVFGGGATQVSSLSSNHSSKL
ncbi:hypothetical protein AVEN_198272-1 [Araneus ventricosus]|uniref:Uncharacterized protein n=1 Tax=Araneus ventricosus TaxID=182803 RepID=A0A4Y2X581_ARAVE|nr:hypothetical protein AVEN_121174-1 [Araneus ventricosus]GBO43288.1 hypothetical protein AVEN_198272-1 [Araneus ventricosus]